MQIAGGLNYLFDVPNTIMTQGIIILIVTILFLTSAWSGLSRGIQYLSNANIGLAGIILCLFYCRTNCSYFKYVNKFNR